MSPLIDLDLQINDVVQILKYEDLHDVILAGHSYGGMVITGVADRARERIRRLVYLDAAHPLQRAVALRQCSRAHGLHQKRLACGEWGRIRALA